jgi:hypothetical protein
MTVAVETQVISPAAGKSGRIPALDFTKGALVLIMVLYHWLNYFYGMQGDIYRYLRFLTPSFIFITGFLISNIYLAKYGITAPQLPKRLAERGLKLLGVFLLLNLARTLLQSGADRAKIIADHSSVRSVLAIYVVGSNLGSGLDKTIAFSILLPIGYLLILSAALLFACRYYRYVFHAVWLLFAVATLTAGVIGVHSANLELLTIGLLGVLSGYLPIAKINALVRHPYFLTAAYLGYVAAITVWDVIYPLQVVGVCLSLMVLYLMGEAGGQPGRIRSSIILLGKYSLLGYIAQIAILQVLHRGLRHVSVSELVSVLAFAAAVALTFFVVAATDSARASRAGIDRLYRAVFA